MSDPLARSVWDDRNFWQFVIPALGVLLLAFAVGKSVTALSGDYGLVEAGLDLVLLSSPGLVMLYVGLWLPSSTIEPRFYPRIVAWIVGGVTVMGIVLGLRVVHPGVEVQFTFGTQAVLLSIGSIAGLGIGVNNALARTSAEELEARNEELQRTERRLEEAVGELETSNERLEQFAYAASHDMQEPLRMVTRYLELVEERYGEELDDDCSEFIEFALDGADRMSSMIDGLLEYTRVETQGGTFDAVDLDDVLDDVVADLQFRIEETDATITRESLPTVDGDRRQLHQLFQNLVSNAMEYSGDEPPRIHVTATEDPASNEPVSDEPASDEPATEGPATTEPAAERGSTWTVSVRDQGIGIDPEDAERIFDVFERLHSVDDHAGSGIGLALCKRIVERHDGVIRVDGEPGVGSTFSFSLDSQGSSSDPAAVAAGSEAASSVAGERRPS